MREERVRTSDGELAQAHRRLISPARRLGRETPRETKYLAALQRHARIADFPGASFQQMIGDGCFE